ncbi:MAG: helix-hairpin-helix domain-containing protein, partial [Bacteroidales bacterium]|nr:helix-hairpin-helix domain-containing protein [Bacteroidales bacterium]
MSGQHNQQSGFQRFPLFCQQQPQPQFRPQNQSLHFRPQHPFGGRLDETGLQPKQAQAAEKYRQRGGVFRKKDDLKKLFFVDEDDFQILEPYIVIKKIPERERSYEHSTANAQRPAETKKIELNTADTSDLKELRGIGSGYAKRIVKYRERLGGFCKPEQLLEVYGFT